MFRDCTSLKTAPPLPARKLAYECYNGMFSKCESLETAPELPATELEKNCYIYMFSGCTSLKNAPKLPATELAQYCYFAMFSDCTSLQSVTVGFDTFDNLPEGATGGWDGWLDGVAENGTFTWAGDDIYTEREADTIPEGWTIVSAR